ncbi:ABC transporter substrate-binding protein [Lactobacillus delbrueckii subsp. bulgaricus]
MLTSARPCHWLSTGRAYHHSGRQQPASRHFDSNPIDQRQRGKLHQVDPKLAESLYPANPNKKEAVKYMNKGLKELGVSKFSFKILSDDTDAGNKTNEALQSNFESTFGDKVSVSVQNLPFKTRLSRSIAGNFDIVVSGWSADFADPISFLDLLTKSNAYNYGKWESTAYNKNVSLSKTTGSTATCWKAMVAAERALLEDQGVTPLYYTNEAPPASRALSSTVPAHLTTSRKPTSSSLSSLESSIKMCFTKKFFDQERTKQ